MTDTATIRRAFEAQAIDVGFRNLTMDEGVYTVSDLTVRWLWFQRGYNAASQEAAPSGPLLTYSITFLDDWISSGELEEVGRHWARVKKAAIASQEAALAAPAGEPVPGYSTLSPKEARDLAIQQQGWKREAEDLDDLLKLVLPGRDPDDFRTDGGNLNLSNVRAALSSASPRWTISDPVPTAPTASKPQCQRIQCLYPHCPEGSCCAASGVQGDKP